MITHNAYLAMEMVFFPVDLSIIVITIYSAIRLIVEFLLWSSDRAFPGWDPGPGVRFPSTRRQNRVKPRFDPSQHTRRRRHRKQYNRQWKRNRVYPGRLKTFVSTVPDTMPTPWLTVFVGSCVAAVAYAVKYMSSWVSMFIHRRWVTTSLAKSRTKRNFASTYLAFAGSIAAKLPNALRFDTDSFRLGIDTFASACMSPTKSHFTDYVSESGTECKGIASGLSIVGRGTLNFRIDDDDGRTHEISIPNSVHIPDLPMVLIAPQHWAQNTDDGMTETTGATSTVIRFRGYSKTIPFNPRTNTPSFRSATGTLRYQAFAGTIDHLDGDSLLSSEHIVTDDECTDSEGESGDEYDEYELGSDEELPMSAREGETVHCKQQHQQQARHDSPPVDGSIESVDLAKSHPHADDAQRLTVENPQADLLRWHYRLGHLSFKLIKAMAQVGLLPKRIATAPTPKCAGCMFSSMTKKPWRTKGSKGNQVGRRTKVTRPGQCVSVDQLESPQVGFYAQLKGIPTKKRYRYATIFVDHFSDLKYVHYMEDSTSKSTVYAKECFERYAAAHGVHVEHYHCDNGRFADNGWVRHCEAMGQTITYCGVNAHFQNGKAEKAIRDIQTAARTMLLHAKSRWPDAIHLSLWPYAMRMAVHIHNNVPNNEDGSSRLEAFARISVSPKADHYHTFGCPVYRLTTKAATNKSAKWENRANLGIYLGPSPQHAGSVSLVLSLTSAMASPQFHVGHDDFFETTRYNRSSARTKSKWQQLSGIDLAVTLEKRDKIKRAALNKVADRSTIETPADVANLMPVFDHTRTASLQSGNLDQVTPSPYQAPTVSEPTPVASVTDVPDISSRGRHRTPAKVHNVQAFESEFVTTAFQSTFETEHDRDMAMQERMRSPIAFLSEMNGDTMYFHQAMRQDDSADFVEAVVKEINGHVENKHWELIPAHDVPDGEEVLPSVWAMRRKRNLVTNEITKYKARINVHGGKQTLGVNYFDTYAPVVTWFAIRLLIIIAMVLSWQLRQVDFIMAYPQAPIECDMYLKIPDGCETDQGSNKTHVLKLLKNVYGQKQAGRVWNDYLTGKLLGLGFTRSLIDECVFYRGSLVFLLYVDDGIFVSLDGSDIDETIKELQRENLKIEDQGHPADYVGVNINKLPDNSYEFTQPALTRQIIDDVGLGPKATTKPIPMCAQRLLHHHLDSPAHDESRFSYRSVIGKLNYLAQCSRPDIVYAVHQCARFSSNPRQEHTWAVEYLVRYLKGTPELGVKFTPDPTKSFECYADADYCGNWSKAFADVDPSTAKSRSGWIILYAGCPVIWASKLQTHIATSTTMAEYLSLSSALRDVIPLMELLDEFNERKYDLISAEPKIYCKAFEDNSGALEIARLPKMRPRTKAINVVYHHFREYVRLGLISIYPVSTDDQLADIFTKPLTQNTFVRFRKLLSGS